MMTSGAKYSAIGPRITNQLHTIAILIPGVPHMVHARSNTRLAKPKSVSFKFPETHNVIARRTQQGSAAHTVMINENVLRLQVAVHDVEVVQVLDGQHGLGTEKSSLLFVEVSVSLALHQCEHLAAVDILENKVQRARCDPGG